MGPCLRRWGVPLPGRVPEHDLISAQRKFAGRLHHHAGRDMERAHVHAALDHVAFDHAVGEARRRVGAFVVGGVEPPEIIPTIVLPLSTAADGLAAALGNYPSWRGLASAYRRRGRCLETVAPRMLRWSSFRMRQQKMMQDMK